MRWFLWNLLGGALIVTISTFIALLACGYITGTHTPYCPWRHKLSDTASCVVLDRKGARILIQHADLDTNEYYLEILNDQQSRTFKMPDFITQLAPQGYSAELIVGDDQVILINGTRYLLEPLAAK
jgi:hypothetical protein